MKRVLRIVSLLVLVGLLVFRLAIKYEANDLLMREVQDHVNKQMDELYGKHGMSRFYREFEENMDALIEGMDEENLDAYISFANWYNSLEEKDQLQVRDWAENTYKYSH